MEENLKQLLLKDLCARVLYHPKGHVVNACNGAECDEWLTCATFTMFTNVTNNCRLYLRPMSSMTEDEYKGMQMVLGRGEYAALMNKTSGLELWLESVDTDPTIWFDSLVDVQDWLNANHFDYRNLIEKGLALEAPEGMYNIK